MYAAELGLHVGVHRPVRTHRAAFADDPLTMIIGETAWRLREVLRLTDAGGVLIEIAREGYVGCAGWPAGSLVCSSGSRLCGMSRQVGRG